MQAEEPGPPSPYENPRPRSGTPASWFKPHCQLKYENMCTSLMSVPFVWKVLLDFISPTAQLISAHKTSLFIHENTEWVHLKKARTESMEWHQGWLSPKHVQFPQNKIHSCNWALNHLAPFVILPHITLVQHSSLCSVTLLIWGQVPRAVEALQIPLTVLSDEMKS